MTVPDNVLCEGEYGHLYFNKLYVLTQKKCTSLDDSENWHL